MTLNKQPLMYKMITTFGAFVNSYFYVNHIEWNGLQHLPLPALNIKAEVVNPLDIHCLQYTEERVAGDVESVILLPHFLALLENPTHVAIRAVFDMHGLLLGGQAPWKEMSFPVA